MNYLTKENLIIGIILLFLYLHECKKEAFTIPKEKLPLIKINSKSQIAVVTIMPEKLKPIDQLIVQNYKIYCEKNNLALYIFTNSEFNKHNQWNPINSTYEVMQYKYHICVIYMNQNVIFNNYKIYVNKYISKYPNSHIIFSKDPINKNIKFSMNIIIFINSEWCNKILKKIIDSNNKKYSKHIVEHFGDSLGYHVLLNNTIQDEAINEKKVDEKTIHKNISILPAEDINDLASKKTLKKNLIVNISNIPEKTKYKLIKYINQDLE